MGWWSAILLTFYKEEDTKKVWDGLKNKKGQFSFYKLIKKIEEDDDIDEEDKEEEEEANKNEEEEEDDIDPDWCLDHYGFSFIDDPRLDGKTIKFIAKNGVPNSEFLQALSEMFNVEFTIIAWSDPGSFFQNAVIPIRFPNFHPKYKYYEWDDNNDCVSRW